MENDKSVSEALVEFTSDLKAIKPNKKQYQTLRFVKDKYRELVNDIIYKAKTPEEKEHAKRVFINSLSIVRGRGKKGGKTRRKGGNREQGDNPRQARDRLRRRENILRNAIPAVDRDDTSAIITDKLIKLLKKRPRTVAGVDKLLKELNKLYGTGLVAHDDYRYALEHLINLYPA